MAEAENSASSRVSDFIIVQEGKWSLNGREGSYTCSKDGAVTADCTGFPNLSSNSQFVFNSCHSNPLPFNAPKAPIPINCVRNDVMALIADPSNQGAFFLLPSQLNGAEYVTNSRPTEKVAAYVWDNTGGPAGQLSGHPGIAQFILDNAENSNRVNSGINSVKEFLPCVNLDIPSASPLQNVNGYLKVQPQYLENAEEFLERMRLNLQLIRVPAMLNVQASGLLPGRRQFSNNQHTVNLIYGSGVPVGTYGNDYSQFVQEVAFHIVVSQYYGGIKLAASRGAKRIFLMLLGAGVFNMAVPTVLKAIDLAVDLLYADESVRQGLEALDITVLTYASFETQVVQGRLNTRNANLTKTPSNVSDVGERRESDGKNPSLKRRKTDDG